MKQYSISSVDNGQRITEELSLKKHFSRRQQTDKPVLRHDTDSNLGRPLQYDNVTCSDFHIVHPLSVSSPNTPTKIPPQSGFINTMPVISQKRFRNGSSGSVQSRTSFVNDVSDANGRPFSATEVVRDYPPSHRFQPLQHPHKAGGSVGMSMVTSYSTSMLDQPEKVLLPGPSSLQFTSQSHNDLPVSVAAKSSLKREQKAIGLISDDMRQVCPRVPSPSVSHRARTGLPPRPRDSYMARDSRVSNGAHMDLTHSHSEENVENSGLSQPARSVFTTSKGSKTPSSVYASGRSQLDNPKTPLGKIVTNNQVEPLAGDISSMAGVEESGLPLHNLTASSLLNTRMGVLRKMPSAKPMPGPLYLKKTLPEAGRQVSRKGVSVGLEQRSGGDGAPAKQISALPAEKVDGTGYTNEMDEEDDVSMPSGERLPGDGEASDADELGDFDDDDDDDGIDDLYEDGQDNNETDYRAGSSLSQESTSTIPLPPAESRPSTTHCAVSRASAVGEEHPHVAARPQTSAETQLRPALTPSLFPAVPPTIHFVPDGEKVEQLSWEIRKLLKWRMSPITPNVVKSALRRSNFRITKKNHDWLGCFGKHMKSTAFKSIREYQKLNHYPGSFQLGRKDQLWRNLSHMQVSFGKKEFGFFPQTYILPQDMKHLRRMWEDSTAKQKWIIKPPASARGIGIKVISKWTQIPRRKPVIVQKYLSKPFLINDSKFDMRVYVYVACFDPLRVYIYEDGLARFASCKYSVSMKNLSNKYMHLTNYSINKRNADYQTNHDNSTCQGHKWSLKSLWNYLQDQGVDTLSLWDNIKDIIIKTIISADGPINTMIKSNVRCRYSIHELFGFDILLDEHLRPWILEVNISPSLHSSSPLDISIKGPMVSDMFNLAGFHVPDKNDIVNSAHNPVSVPDLSAHTPSTDYCIDKRLFTNQLASDERAKHAYFCHKNQDEQVLQGILDTLTPDDVRVLTESMDEDSRKGGFIRVFPTPTTKRYLRFFEQPRYYNLLLDQWVARYHRMEQRGISILQGLCEEGLHLDNPTDNIDHQWCPPNSTAGLLSARDKIPSPLKKDSLGQSKSSSTLTRLPRVRNSTTDHQSTSFMASALGSSSFTTLPRSPIPRPIKPLDPAR